MAQTTHVFAGEESSVLDTIHAEPKTDGLRTVCADWLDDHGATEHAEFIRLQCRKLYIALYSREPNNPKKGIYYDFPWDEPTAQARPRSYSVLTHPLAGNRSRSLILEATRRAGSFSRAVPQP